MSNPSAVPALPEVTISCPASLEEALRLFPDKLVTSDRMSAKDQILAILSSCKASLPKREDAALSIVLDRFAQGDSRKAVRDALTDIWNNKPHKLPKTVRYPSPETEVVCDVDLIESIARTEYGVSEEAIYKAFYEDALGDEIDRLFREAEEAAGISGEDTKITSEPSVEGMNYTSEAPDTVIKEEKEAEASDDLKCVSESVIQKTAPIEPEGHLLHITDITLNSKNYINSTIDVYKPIESSPPKKSVCVSNSVINDRKDVQSNTSFYYPSSEGYVALQALRETPDARRG